MKASNAKWRSLGDTECSQMQAGTTYALQGHFLLSYCSCICSLANPCVQDLAQKFHELRLSMHCATCMCLARCASPQERTSPAFLFRAGFLGPAQLNAANPREVRDRCCFWRCFACVRQTDHLFHLVSWQTWMPVLDACTITRNDRRSFGFHNSTCT